MAYLHHVNREKIVAVRHVGDNLRPLVATLYPKEGNTPIDLTGLDVEFYMLDSAGGIKVAQSDTGVSVDADPTTGIVSKTFLAADVDTPGDFYAYFVVLSGTDRETFPPDTGRFLVQFQAD